MYELSYIVMISLFAILVRWGVSLSGYSGEGKPPMFGDYEAQRHWMEVTLNLPAKEWYHNSSSNDLQYWGLDYPPLTAYHSWLCGVISRYINPDWVALNQSRGYESYEHKLFMRYSVLAADVLLCFPAVYWIFAARKPNPKDADETTKSYLLMLLYPGLILIDHGHFQYNCVSLGLALLAVTSVARGRDVVGAGLFCLALNYKQMELYHALPFFCFLLGTCLHSIRDGGLLKLVKIATTVIFTFVLCWLPFLYSRDSVLQILHRLFPFARGIYEDKVSNVWCAVSVLVKLKHFLSGDHIVLLCLATTLLALLPLSIDLLISPTFKKFRLALVNSSLVFFLFSFQVHEKSILIPALVVCTFIPDIPFWSFWFLMISTFSMLPLIIKDGQLVPYVATMVLFSVMYYHFYPGGSEDRDGKPPPGTPDWPGIVVKLVFCISMVGMVVLTLASVMVPPPDSLPYLFPLVISVYSCGHFLMFLAYFHYAQFTTSQRIRPSKAGTAVKVAVTEVYKSTKVKAWKSEKAKRKKHL